MQKWQLALRIIGMGWYVAIAILLGVLGGSWLDGKLGTRPLFVISGLLLGIVTAFYGLIKMLLPLVNTKQKRNDD